MNAPRHDDAVKDYYDDWNERYIESFGDIFQAARTERVDDLIAHVVRMAGLQDGMRMLDAGCGICGPSIRIARMVNVSIDAVTISPVQADFARKRVQEAGLADRITVTWPRSSAPTASTGSSFSSRCATHAILTR